MGLLSGLIGNAFNQVSSLLPSKSSGGILTGLVGGLFGDMQAQEQMEQQYATQYKYSAALQQMQNDWNEKMWNMNNQYNSPVEQIKRLEAAGLNRNLAYGSLSGNVASPPSSTSRGIIQGDNAATIALRNQQANQIKQVTAANVNLLNSQADAQSAQAEYYRSQATKGKTENDLLKAELEGAAERWLATNSKIWNDSWLSERMALYYQQEFGYLNSKNLREDAFNLKAMEKIDAEINNIKELLPYQKKALQAAAYLSNMQGDYYFNVKEGLKATNYILDHYTVNEDGKTTLRADQLKSDVQTGKLRALLTQYDVDSYSYKNYWLPVVGAITSLGTSLISAGAGAVGKVAAAKIGAKASTANAATSADAKITAAEINAGK